ncbi:hypothetical protein BJX66DRAFT_75391 [Aspergillus keveii]|uniref:Uncharacterized protein n=1 Tax=Aspergillus keveii TaxID=714993 RepID=A0ABR4FNQ7_9EURO
MRSRAVLEISQIDSQLAFLVLSCPHHAPVQFQFQFSSLFSLLESLIRGSRLSIAHAYTTCIAFVSFFFLSTISPSSIALSNTAIHLQITRRRPINRNSPSPSSLLPAAELLLLLLLHRSGHQSMPPNPPPARTIVHTLASLGCYCILDGELHVYHLDYRLLRLLSCSAA